MERTEERSHGGATGFQPPEGVKFHRIPGDDSIGAMLSDGRLDATLLYLTDNNLVDRSRIKLEGNPAFKMLFPDPAAEGRRYYAKTGIFPINHGMVVRRPFTKHPWVALNIFNAFDWPKAGQCAHARGAGVGTAGLGLLDGSARQALAVVYPTA
jgi:4,5-dihydroxyphthalate decarboxylase